MALGEGFGDTEIGKLAIGEARQALWALSGNATIFFRVRIKRAKTARERELFETALKIVEAHFAQLKAEARERIRQEQVQRTVPDR